MFDELSQGMFLLFVFEAWDCCFQLVGPLVDLLHFIFEIANMSIPRIFGHSIALPLASYRHNASSAAAATALWGVLTTTT